MGTAVVPDTGDGRHVTLRLGPPDGRRFPQRLATLLQGAGLRAGDSVTVDLARADLALTELGLLLGTLWRRVGPHGDVRVAGVPAERLRRWARAGVAPATARALVLGGQAAEPRPEPLALPSPRLAADDATVPASRQRVPEPA